MTEPSAPIPRAPDELGFERIVYEKAPPRATITLNRPERLNAFDFLTLRELARAAEDASWDDDVRVVVVTGAGRAFCVGADLKEWQADYLGNPSAYWKWFGAFKDAHDRLREIGKPTVARINGICVGGGNELQMACDLAVMVDDAYIRHVGLEHGSVPAGGATQWLPIMVGERRAREIVMLCEEIPASRRQRSGGSSTGPSRPPSSTRRSTSWSRSSLRSSRRRRATRSSSSTSGATSPGTRPSTTRATGSRCRCSADGGAGRRARASWSGSAMSEAERSSSSSASPRRRIATVLLNRPDRLNALNGELMDELVDVAARARCRRRRPLHRPRRARACLRAGADIAEMATASPIDMLSARRVDRWDALRAVGRPSSPPFRASASAAAASSP